MAIRRAPLPVRRVHGPTQTNQRYWRPRRDRQRQVDTEDKAHHSAGHCLRRAVATSLIVHWRPQRCAPCQPDGLSPTAHRTRHDPSATSPKRTLNPHGDALHRQGSWLFGQDCRRLEIAVHPLIDPPLASLVEADRRPSCGNPQLLVTLPMCPPHKVREQKPSDTCSATVAPNDHAQQPRERSRRSSISN